MQNQDYDQGQRQIPPQPQPDYTGRRRDLPYKVPFLAGLLSLFPGLGHVYIGYYQMGLTLGALFIGFVTMLNIGLGPLEPLFGLSLAFTMLYGIIDAVRRAGAYNRALDGLAPDQELPELTMPGWKGSRAGGIILIVLGGLLLMETAFDIDLEWLENVWPLALVVGGAWLLYKSREDHPREPGA